MLRWVGNHLLLKIIIFSFLFSSFWFFDSFFCYSKFLQGSFIFITFLLSPQSTGPVAYSLRQSGGRSNLSTTGKGEGREKKPYLKKRTEVQSPWQNKNVKKSQKGFFIGFWEKKLLKKNNWNIEFFLFLTTLPEGLLRQVGPGVGLCPTPGPKHLHKVPCQPAPRAGNALLRNAGSSLLRWQAKRWAWAKSLGL